MRSHRVLPWAVLSVLGGLANSSRGALISWDGGTSGAGSAWGTATNWSTNTVPTLNDNLLFTAISPGAIPTAMSLSGSNVICQSVTWANNFNATNTSLVQNNSGSGTSSILRLYGDAVGLLLDFQPTSGGFTIQNGTSTSVTQNLNTQIHNSGTINVNAGAVLSILGAFNNSTAAGANAAPVVTKTGGGKLVLGGGSASSYAGSYLINAGTVSINSGASLGTSPASPTTNITFAGNSAIETTGVGNIINVNRLVTVNPGITATLDVVGPSLTGNSVISGDGSLRKAGPGSLILTAANTYAGTTTVNLGILRVNGSHTGAGDYMINTGAVLGGAGTIALSPGKMIVINPGATLAPGNTPGLLSVAGAVDLANDITATLEMEMGGSPSNPGIDFDVLAVDGTFDIAGAHLNLLVPGGEGSVALNTPYTIVTATGGITGTFAMLNDQLASSSYTGLIPYDVTYGNNSIEVTFVPEPLSASLALPGGLLMVRRRKR